MLVDHDQGAGGVAAEEAVAPAGDPETERVVSIGVDGVCVLVEGGQGPAKGCGQRRHGWVRRRARVPGAVLFFLVVCGVHGWVCSCPVSFPSLAWWDPGPGRSSQDQRGSGGLPGACVGSGSARPDGWCTQRALSWGVRPGCGAVSGNANGER